MKAPKPMSFKQLSNFIKKECGQPPGPGPPRQVGFGGASWQDTACTRWGAGQGTGLGAVVVEAALV